MRNPSSHLARVAVASAVLWSAAACGSDGDVVEATDGSIVVRAAEDAGCVAEKPDLAAADLVPPDFPEPPVDATLCVITGSADTGVDLRYRSDATPDEVLAGYLEAFAAYGAVSEDGLPVRRTDLGRTVTAQAGGVRLQVVPGRGRYEIHLDVSRGR